MDKEIREAIESVIFAEQARASKMGHVSLKEAAERGYTESKLCFRWALELQNVMLKSGEKIALVAPAPLASEPSMMRTRLILKVAISILEYTESQGNPKDFAECEKIARRLVETS